MSVSRSYFLDTLAARLWQRVQCLLQMYQLLAAPGHECQGVGGLRVQKWCSAMDRPLCVLAGTPQGRWHEEFYVDA